MTTATFPYAPAQDPLDPADTSLGIYHIDFDRFAVDTKTCLRYADLVFADPEYADLGHYARIMVWALHALKPGRPCLLFYGGAHPEGIISLGRLLGLKFVWQFNYVVPGKSGKLRGYNLFPKSTPLFWFRTPGRMVKARRGIADTFIDNTPPAGNHIWNKNPAVIAYYMTALCQRGELVVDPCCGEGVVPVVARQTGRRWLACEINEPCVWEARDRVLHTGIQPSLFDLEADDAATQLPLAFMEDGNGQ